MRNLFITLVEQLGWPGKVAIILFAVGGMLVESGVAPLQMDIRRLDASIRRATEDQHTTDASFIRTASPSAKLAAFYQYFQRDEATTDWLAKLYSIAVDTGVGMRVADYHLERSAGRLDRYQITMPLTGDYSQVRAFLENALLQIPVLSVDQVTFQRKRISEPTVEAQVRLTLHLLRP